MDVRDIVYAADLNSHRIQLFTIDGAYSTQFGGQGGGVAQFGEWLGLAVDSDHRVYVADTDNDRIQVFTVE